MGGSRRGRKGALGFDGRVKAVIHPVLQSQLYLVLFLLLFFYGLFCCCCLYSLQLQSSYSGVFLTLSTALGRAMVVHCIPSHLHWNQMDSVRQEERDSTIISTTTPYDCEAETRGALGSIHIYTPSFASGNFWKKKEGN